LQSRHCIKNNWHLVVHIEILSHNHFGDILLTFFSMRKKLFLFLDPAWYQIRYCAFLSSMTKCKFHYMFTKVHDHGFWIPNKFLCLFYIRYFIFYFFISILISYYPKSELWSACWSFKTLFLFAKSVRATLTIFNMGTPLVLRIWDFCFVNVSHSVCVSSAHDNGVGLASYGRLERVAWI